MKTLFTKKENHIPKCFVIDAAGKTLGRLASKASQLLSGSNTPIYTPGLDQGNFVIIINAEKIQVSGSKLHDKIYFNSTQRPGTLKSISFINLITKMPYMPLEKAILGMLPKNKLRKCYLRRLFIYSSNVKIEEKILDFSKKKITWIL